MFGRSPEVLDTYVYLKLYYIVLVDSDCLNSTPNVLALSAKGCLVSTLVIACSCKSQCCSAIPCGELQANINSDYFRLSSLDFKIVGELLSKIPMGHAWVNVCGFPLCLNTA